MEMMLCRKKDYIDILQLESFKHFLMSKIFCMLVYHLVSAEVVHQQQHFSILILSSNRMQKISNYGHEYIRAYPGGGVEITINAVTAKRIEDPPKSIGPFRFLNQL